MIRLSAFITLGFHLFGGSTVSAQELEMREGTVSTNGVDIYYRVVGEGPPLLLLHGFTNTGEEWVPYFATFGQDYTLIVPDFRGHGRSTNPGGEFTHRLAAGDILRLLDALGIERLQAIGYSSGAVALIEMSLLDPDRLDAMVLVDGSHRFPDETRAILKAADVHAFAQVSPWWTELVSSWHPGGMEQLRRLFQQVRMIGANPDDGNVTESDLARVKAKTLIIHGDRDEIYPLNLAIEMYMAIPDAYLWVMPNTSHDAVFWYRYAPADYACGGCEAADAAFPGVVRSFLSGAL